MKNIRFIDRSLDLATEELLEAIKWRDRSLAMPAASIKCHAAMRSAMRSHALNSRRSFAGQLLYGGGQDPRNVGPLPLANLPR